MPPKPRKQREPKDRPRSKKLRDIPDHHFNILRFPAPGAVRSTAPGPPQAAPQPPAMSFVLNNQDSDYSTPVDESEETDLEESESADCSSSDHPGENTVEHTALIINQLGQEVQGAGVGEQQDNPAEFWYCNQDGNHPTPIDESIINRRADVGIPDFAQIFGGDQPEANPISYTSIMDQFQHWQGADHPPHRNNRHINEPASQTSATPDNVAIHPFYFQAGPGPGGVGGYGVQQRVDRLRRTMESLD